MSSIFRGFQQLLSSLLLNEKRSCYFLNEDTVIAELSQNANFGKSGNFRYLKLFFTSFIMFFLELFLQAVIETTIPNHLLYKWTKLTQGPSVHFRSRYGGLTLRLGIGLSNSAPPPPFKGPLKCLAPWSLSWFPCLQVFWCIHIISRWQLKIYYQK